ncbi:hypothetical protein VTN77DRAFT_2082 [Rasamsonia byssochlamydoides]|uniref:uncharacterized protein n=1 Tax=Rasamsonia byssochlamydoides TaxID=89139 RepID=UPI0037425460
MSSSESTSTSTASSSRSRTPQGPTTLSPSTSFSDVHSAASYFSYPVSRVVSGLYRRLTDQDKKNNNNNSKQQQQQPRHEKTTGMISSSSPEVFTPKRTASPFQPPPLTPLTLKSTADTTHQLLTVALAEEIRLLVPPRLQLVDTWRLAYSLERDGSSLATLYESCRQYSHRSQRAGYVLVVRDTSGGAIFGAYLTDPPHPSPHFYGTGECFLWRASALPSTPVVHHHNNSAGDGAGGVPRMMTDEELERAGLPPPPSADTTHAVRSTTLRGSSTNTNQKNGSDHLAPPGEANGSSSTNNGTAGGSSIDRSGTSTPERIRFKAFPYSGVNDYMIFCETGFLSVGGGDGHYGLWIDDSVEKGISSSCLTFGNEPLSDEGTKFDILGVEVWYIGA